MSYKILVVDDDQSDLESTRLILSDEDDFEITTTTNSRDAVAMVKAAPHAFAVVLLDFNMPDKNGLDVAKELLIINPNLVIAIFSMDQSRDVLKSCIDSGVKLFIDKNHSDEEVLRSQVRNLCQKWENTAQLFAYSNPNGVGTELIESAGLTGSSQKTAEVVKQAMLAARTNSNVFIRGESGTGKELIARAIHKLSPRKAKPFVAINVNAIPENLVESELFGHVKGAFTGADRNVEGKLAAAQGGTFFLDEIGDLKPDLQVKLLRVLQERKVTPVGGNRPFTLDIRFITATHVDIEKAILDGRFREDLYYRLYVLPIEIPPLRERSEDIRPLIDRFLKMYGTPNHRILEKTVQYLERYQWRGNVRELENEIQRMVSITSSAIEPKHLSQKIKDFFEIDSDQKSPDHRTFMRSLNQMEWDYIHENILKAGSIREACRSIFDVSNSTIHTRIGILKEILKPTERTENETEI